MPLRKLNTLVACLVGLLFGPASMLFAQQPADEPLPAGQPITKSPDDVSKLFLGVKLRQRVQPEFASVRLWRLAAATYGNQVGVEIADPEAALRTQLGLENESGVLVTGVSPESAAAKAGIIQHDLVLKIDDQNISGAQQFNELMGSLQGKAVQFHILRKGKPAAISVTLPKSPVYEILDNGSLVEDEIAVTRFPAAQSLAAALALNHVAAQRHYRIGVTLAEADDVLRSQLRLAAGEGLVVTDVLADSPAAKAGILQHDVLTKLDGKRLTAVDTVNAQIQEIKDRAVPVALFRTGSELVLTVTPRLTDEGSYRLSVLRHYNDLVRIRLEAADLALQETQAKAIVPESAARPPAAAQLAEVKKQLADLQKAIEGLEATIQSESANKQQPSVEGK